MSIPSIQANTRANTQVNDSFRFAVVLLAWTRLTKADQEEMRGFVANQTTLTCGRSKGRMLLSITISQFKKLRKREKAAFAQLIEHL